MRATDQRIKFNLGTTKGPTPCEGTIVELDALPGVCFVAHHRLVEKRKKWVFDTKSWVVSHYATGVCIDETAARGSIEAAMQAANRILREQLGDSEALHRVINKYPVLNEETP